MSIITANRPIIWKLTLYSIYRVKLSSFCYSFQGDITSVNFLIVIISPMTMSLATVQLSTWPDTLVQLCANGRVFANNLHVYSRTFHHIFFLSVAASLKFLGWQNVSIYSIPLPFQLSLNERGYEVCQQAYFISDGVSHCIICGVVFSASDSSSVTSFECLYSVFLLLISNIPNHRESLWFTLE